MGMPSDRSSSRAGVTGKGHAREIVGSSGFVEDKSRAEIPYSSRRSLARRSERRSTQLASRLDTPRVRRNILLVIGLPVREDLALCLVRYGTKESVGGIIDMGETSDSTRPLLAFPSFLMPSCERYSWFDNGHR